MSKLCFLVLQIVPGVINLVNLSTQGRLTIYLNKPKTNFRLDKAMGDVTALLRLLTKLKDDDTGECTMLPKCQNFLFFQNG